MTRETILVTGASSDIGLALIGRLAAREAPVRILAHYHSSAARIEQLKAELKVGDAIVPLACDFGDDAAVRDFAQRVTDEFGIPRSIVHLPALPLIYERFKKFQWEHFAADLNVQVRSVVLLLQRCLPAMAKVPSSRVVFLLSSVTRGVPPKLLSMYTTVKFAQLGLMRALASEYGGAGVTINAVSADMVETRFLQNVPDLVKQMAAQASPKGRIATTAEVVAAIQFLLSPEAEYIHGIELPVTGGSVY